MLLALRLDRPSLSRHCTIGGTRYGMCKLGFSATWGSFRRGVECALAADQPVIAVFNIAWAL